MIRLSADTWVGVPARGVDAFPELKLVLQWEYRKREEKDDRRGELFRPRGRNYLPWGSREVSRRAARVSGLVALAAARWVRVAVADPHRMEARSSLPAAF
jgi:hypothetical protein